jgi:hypothetical protein
MATTIDLTAPSIDHALAAVSRELESNLDCVAQLRASISASEHARYVATISHVADERELFLLTIGILAGIELSKG